MIRAKDTRLLQIGKTKRAVQRLDQFLEEIPSTGEMVVNLKNGKNDEDRQARMAIKYSSISLRPKVHRCKNSEYQVNEPIKLTVIEACEIDPPKGEEKLHLVLFTSDLVNDFNDACIRISWYSKRWTIEVFHKILKSGLKVESSRLGTRERVVKFLALASVLAFRIHWLTIASRKNPESSCEVEFSSDEWKPLAILNGNKINNETPPTIKEMTRWIAKLGGFMDRKGDGDPGAITLWRGLGRLFEFLRGWRLAHENQDVGKS